MKSRTGDTNNVHITELNLANCKIWASRSTIYKDYDVTIKVSAHHIPLSQQY